MLYTATDTMYPGQIQCLWDILHQITLAIYPVLSFPHHTWSWASASWSQYSSRLLYSLPSPIFLRLSNQALRLNLKLDSTFCGLDNLQWHMSMCIHICVRCVCANSSLIKETPFAELFVFSCWTDNGWLSVYSHPAHPRGSHSVTPPEGVAITGNHAHGYWVHSCNSNIKSSKRHDYPLSCFNC